MTSMNRNLLLPRQFIVKIKVGNPRPQNAGRTHSTTNTTSDGHTRTHTHPTTTTRRTHTHTTTTTTTTPTHTHTGKVFKITTATDPNITNEQSNLRALRRKRTHTHTHSHTHTHARTRARVYTHTHTRESYIRVSPVQPSVSDMSQWKSNHTTVTTDSRCAFTDQHDSSVQLAPVCLLCASPPYRRI